MSTSGLIEFHANALALAMLIQAKTKAKAKGEDESVPELVSYPRMYKEYLAQPIADMTRQDIWNMVDRR